MYPLYSCNFAGFVAAKGYVTVRGVPLIGDAPYCFEVAEMYYSYDVTMPTKIESVADYKERIYEIVHGQMKNIVLKERVLNPFFWLFSVVAIPMSIAYCLLCICEIFVDTILLPFFCIPYVRGIPFIVSVIVWSIGIAIGIFAFVPLTYDVDYRPKKGRNNAKANRSTSMSRQATISKQLDTAKKLYVYYGVGSRFNDDMGILCEEYENILVACKDNFALNSAARKCMAVSMYYLFDLSKLYYAKESVVGAIAQIIYNETHGGKLNAMSFLNSKSWFEVRMALIKKINGYAAYERKRYAL